jgi:hypothetical protein
MAENVLFGSEFDGKPIIDGVNEVVVKLAEIKQAQRDLREETNRLNKALDDNQKELTETKIKLEEATKAGDPKKIKELSDQITVLTAKEKELTGAMKEANTQQIVLQKGASFYSKQINETVKNQHSANEEFGKLTSISRLAGEGVGLLRRQVTDLAFGLVSGLAGGIIATVIPAVLNMISNLFKAGKELDALNKKQELFKGVAEDAAKSVASQVTKLEAYRKLLQDNSLSEEQRLKVVKEYNKTADEKNKIDEKQVDNITLINAQLDKQKEKLIQVALATAATNKVTEAAEPFIEAQLKFRLSAASLGITETQLSTFVNFNNKLREQLDVGEARTRKTITQREKDNKILEDFSKNTGITQKNLAQFTNQLEAVTKTKKGLDDVTNALSSLINFEGVVPTGGKTDEIANVFARELGKLTQRLKTVQVAQLPSESLIQEQFEAKLNNELKEIDKFLDKKSKERVTPQQAAILKNLVRKITGIEEETNLEEFRKKIQDINDQINNAIEQVRTDDANKRIANIRDDFERERQAIEQGFQNSVAALGTARDNLLKKVDEAEKAGLDRATAQRKRFSINSVFGELIDQATVTKTNQQLDLSFKTFQKTVTDSNIVFEEQLTVLDEKTAKQIVDEKNKLATGAINYDKFQKNVTKILKDEKEKRDKIRKDELENDLAQINVRITTTTDPEQLKKLEDQARQIRQQISAIDSNVEGEKKDPVTKRIDNVSKYAQSVGSLLNTIGQFWVQVNAIEQKSLERSISLQEKRVEEARTIAERGNAQYLNDEQDRLDELELKRAASARKQQAINSALVLSNALVATVSAIAQAASTSGPAAPFAAIAAGIAVIGAITAAFSFVQSLQPPEATFRHGVEEVKQNGHPSGIDTIPARVSIGERVVTSKENKDYFETLTAIHNRKVSPEVLNSFVKQTLTGQKPGIKENRIERTVVERFREKAQKDRLTKEDRQLTKDIAKEVSSRITNSQDKDRVFNYVEHVLTQRFESKPLIIPGIMKLIREQVTNKEVSKERNQISEILDRFSERIQLVQNMQTKTEKIHTGQLIRELTKVITTEKDLDHIEEHLKETIYNPETVKVLVPLIREQLKNQSPEKSVSSQMEHTEKIIERQFAKILSNPATQKQLIQYITNDVFTKHIHRAIQTLATLPNPEQMIERIATDRRMIQVEKGFTEKFNDKVKDVQSSEFNVLKIAEKLLDQKFIVQKFADRVNKTEKEKVIQQIFQERFLQENREYKTTLDAVFDKTIDSKTLNEFVEHSLNRQFVNQVLKQQLVQNLESDHQETVKELVTYQVKEILERSSDRFSRDHESIDHKTKFEKSNLQLEKYNANRDQVRQHVERIIQTNRLIQAGTPVVNIPRTEIPVISFQRLELATDHSTETKGLLAEQIRIMKENNELQKETNKVLKAMGFELNINERGISGMMMKYLEQQKIDLKT